MRPKPEDLGTTGDGDNYVFTSIFGSMVQYKGLSQGLLVDPVSGSSLVRRVVLLRALMLQGWVWVVVGWPRTLICMGMCNVLIAMEDKCDKGAQ